MTIGPNFDHLNDIKCSNEHFSVANAGSAVTNSGSTGRGGLGQNTKGVRMFKSVLFLSAGLAAVLSAAPVAAQTEISWWHAMDA